MGGFDSRPMLKAMMPQLKTKKGIEKMKTLILLIDGIKTTFKITNVFDFTRHGGTVGTTYHLIKSKNTRIRTNIGTLNDADLWQPESFTLIRDEGTELWCSKVRNGKPTYALYDVVDVFDVAFLGTDITPYEPKAVI